MAVAMTKKLSDVAVLTKSIEFVIRNLVKILVGKISLVRLQEMIEQAFVGEAELALRRERPGHDVPLTKLAILTGLDTRKLARIRNRDSFRRPIHTAHDFLEGLMPESCVIDLWTSNPRFTDAAGEPRIIEIWGQEASFEILVKEAVRSRGITVASVISRMQNNRQVRVLANERIELTSKQLAPKHMRQQIGNIKLGLDAVGHLLSTVHRNLIASESGALKVFQRGSWTHRLSPKKREHLAATIEGYLSKVDDEVREILADFEEERAVDTQLTAGVGLYYFETETF